MEQVYRRIADGVHWRTISHNAVDLVLFWTDEQLFCTDQSNRHPDGLCGSAIGFWNFGILVVYNRRVVRYSSKMEHLGNARGGGVDRVPALLDYSNGNQWNKCRMYVYCIGMRHTNDARGESEMVVAYRSDYRLWIIGYRL